MWGRALVAALAMSAAAASAAGQNCTTQAKLVANQRQELADTSLTLANAARAGDAGTVGKLSDRDIAANFAPTGFLIRNLSEAIGGDTMAVTQIYELDAHAATGTGTADFSCPLTGGTSETDFAIEGLPAGLYAFTMVEASGPRPWLLSFLLRQEGGQWKMAGFYPHARTAAGHDGLWYWQDARAKAKSGQPWKAWLEFGTADTLLRPANFVTSTHLDKLRTERSTAAPPELRDGLSAETPLVVKAASVGSAAGASASAQTFAITGLSAEGSDDGKRLNLVVHYRADAPLTDPVAARARNLAAAKALLAAHPELRSGFDGVIVSADSANGQPFPTEFRPAELQ